MLTPAQLDSFIRDGFVCLEEAFPSETALQCRHLLWKATGCDPSDPATWTMPVVRIGEMTTAPFRAAANTTVLHEAFDQLVGPDNWIPRESLGSFPIRFPVNKPASDTGWHVDASFPGDDPADYLQWRINVMSHGRGLLMLFLFSDVGDNDAPTRIRIGSHIVVARLLKPHGVAGLSFMQLAHSLHGLRDSGEALATGAAGTVYLCHPFLVHAAQNHHGNYPKFMAQPPLLTKRNFNIQRYGAQYPVELAINKAIAD
jgi:hypothetical protein